jgi:hypothetical protein
MNPRVIPLVVLCAAIAACAYFFLWSGPSPVDPPSFDAVDLPQTEKAGAARSEGGAEKNPATENSSDGAEKRPAVNWKRFTAMMGGTDGFGDAMPKPTPEDITKFFANHGETAANLVAAFGVTRDRRLIERALELFPNSPIVLLAAIESVPAGAAPTPGETSQPDSERAALIERFKATDPNNPLPWIFSAEEFFKAKQTAQGIAEIRAALEHPAFYTYSNERMDSTQHLYEDMGLHPVEASMLAMAGQTIPHTTAAMQASRSLMEWQKSATESGDTAAADEALRLTYDLGRTFATPEASRTLIGQLVGVSMEARALKALPADAQPEWLAVVPAQRLAEMEKQKQNVKDLTEDLTSIFQSQNEPLLAEYLRRNRNDGELSALTWLKAQKK